MAKGTHTIQTGGKPDKMAMVKAYFEAPEIKKQFEDVLGKRAPGFIVGVLQLVAGNELLQVADLQSLVNATVRAAILNLPLDRSLHLACIVPFKEKGTGKVFAQFQIEWRGFVQLGQATGLFKTINVGDVRQGEYGGKDRLSGEYQWNWNGNDEEREKLPVIGYFSYFKLLSGFEKTVYWTITELNEHALKYSETFRDMNSYWQTNYPDMSKKTVLKENISKWAPLSTAMAMAIEVDQAVITGAEAKIEYMDNPKQAPEVTKRADNITAAAEALKKKLKKK